MFQLETTLRIHKKHSDAGMVCKLHLPQRSQPVHQHILFSEAENRGVLPSHGFFIISALPKSARSTAGVCRRKWEISSLHTQLLQNTSSQQEPQQGPKQRLKGTN